MKQTFSEFNIFQTLLFQLYLREFVNNLVTYM